MPRSQTELRRYLYGSDYTQKPDEAALNDQELAARLAAFQELGKAPGQIDPSGFAGELSGRLKSFGVKDNVDALSNQIASLTQQLGHYPSAEELRNTFSKDTVFSRDANKAVGQEGGGSGWAGGAGIGGLVAGPIGAGVGAIAGGLTQGGGGDTYLRKGYIPPELENFFNDQDTRNQLSGVAAGQLNSIDTTGDVKRLQGIQSGRAFDTQRNNDINDFLTGLPNQLKSSRDEYLQGEANRAGQEFQDYAPQAMAQLNSRGLLFSGSPEDLLTQKATNLAGGLDDLQLKAENDDNQFYFNAAYQNTVKNELASRSDYKSAIDTERSRIMGDRENRFRSSQADYDRQLQEQLSRSDLNRSYQANAANLKAQKAANDSATKGQLYSQIGSTVGAIGGAVVGGPTGATVGAQVGSIPGKVA